MNYKVKRKGENKNRVADNKKAESKRAHFTFFTKARMTPAAGFFEAHREGRKWEEKEKEREKEKDRKKRKKEGKKRRKERKKKERERGKKNGNKVAIKAFTMTI